MGYQEGFNRHYGVWVFVDIDLGIFYPPVGLMGDALYFNLGLWLILYDISDSMDLVIVVIRMARCLRKEE